MWENRKTKTPKNWNPKRWLFLADSFVKFIDSIRLAIDHFHETESTGSRLAVELGRSGSLSSRCLVCATGKTPSWGFSWRCNNKGDMWSTWPGSWPRSCGQAASYSLKAPPGHQPWWTWKDGYHHDCFRAWLYLFIGDFLSPADMPDAKKGKTISYPLGLEYYLFV